MSDSLFLSENYHTWCSLLGFYVSLASLKDTSLDSEVFKCLVETSFLLAVYC